MIRTNRVALYARFSSDNQRSESIDAQIRAMKAYCAQHQYLIVETYIDEAKSATTDRRPAFQQMIADSKSRTFDILLVHKLDRFARNRYDSAVYKKELKKNGVIVCSVLENLDDSPESIMMEAVLEGMSEYYSQNLARETMKGMKETALQCKHTGGKPPLGYDVDPVTKRLIVNEREAEEVRLIFQMYSEGAGYTAILRALNGMGMKTKYGGDFRKNSLSSILRNEKYRGQYVFNRSASKHADGTRNGHQQKAKEDWIIVDGGCPRIVDQAVFDRVQQIMKENQHRGAVQSVHRVYLLAGRVFCKSCGRAMVGNTSYCGRSKLVYATYRCPSQKNLCMNREINKDYLEQYVVFLIKTEFLNRRSLKTIAERLNRAKPPDHRDAFRRRMAEIDAAIENIASAIEGGLLSEALIQRLNDLEAEKRSLNKQQIMETELMGREVCIDAEQILSEFERLQNAGESLKYRDFLKQYIEKIEIGRYTVDITLKTGFGICPQLNQTYTVRRQTIYEFQKNQE